MASYMVAMVTTIQVSAELLNNLKEQKLYDKESYEEVIWDLLEDRMELSEQTKRNIKQSEKEFKEGKFISHEQLKKELDL